MKAKECKICASPWHYQTFCPMKKKKRPNPVGKQEDKYRLWRDEVAIPYLDRTYGHNCMECGVGGRLDVDHIKTRGGHAQLKMQLSNVQYLCRSCHIRKTNAKD